MSNFVLLGDELLLNGTDLLVNVHSPKRCAGQPCVVHNPSDHHMQEWPLHWRDDISIFERICPHGIGHPDPDQFHHWKRIRQSELAVHGCDGCCETPEKGGY